MTTSLEKRRSYRRRTARSICRKKTGKKCLRVKGCKQTRKTMKRKSYCRKLKKHVVMRGGDKDDDITQYLIKLSNNKDLKSFKSELLYNTNDGKHQYSITINRITQVQNYNKKIYRIKNERNNYISSIGDIMLFDCQYDKAPNDTTNTGNEFGIILVYNLTSLGDQHASDNSYTDPPYYRVGKYNYVVDTQTYTWTDNNDINLTLSPKTMRDMMKSWIPLYRKG